MNSKKIQQFMGLAGQKIAGDFVTGTESDRKLGAQLLLSEVLEYVIKGLGIEPEVNGVRITQPDALHYHIKRPEADRLEMLDGLADVAYTMYWNACCFGMPLDEAFDVVCDNNLEKFVRLDDWESGPGPVEADKWHLDRRVCWPPEVVTVEALKVDGTYYAVGKDARGKVRKPSSYKQVDLSKFLQ